MCGDRFSIGFSPNGLMSSGNSSSVSNAVIADFASSSVSQYDMTGYTMPSIVKNPSGVVSNTSVYQTGSTSVMMFSRMADNGVSTEAQISLSGPTYVMWAIGSGQGFSSVPLPQSECDNDDEYV